MRMRIAAAAAAAMLAAVNYGVIAAEDDINADGYDISGFAAQWPEKFAKDDTVTVTDHSYQSHDVYIELTKYCFNRITGDANYDADLTVADAVMLCRIVAEDPTVSVTETGMENADCNEDGTIDAMDVTGLLKYLAKLKTDEEFLIDHHQVYTVADMYLRSIDSLRGAFAKGTFPETGSGQLESVKKMAADNNAIVAINCDYVEIRGNGITYRNGIMYRETYRADVAVIFRDGTMDVLTDAEYRALSEEQRAQIWQTTNFSPGLVKDGIMQTGFRGSVYTNQEPRSGIGYFEPGHFCFVQADGRQPGYSVGITMQQFADFFASLGVQEAYNMDGGSSSEIVFNGETVNSPSGIQIGTTGGRWSSDIMYVCDLCDIPQTE